MPKTDEYYEYLEFLSYKGAHERYNVPFDLINDNEFHPVLERIQEELDVIHDSGFSSYFLIVADVMRFCRERGIPIGPGRGSVCGSAVAFATGIIDVDPIRWKIPFWRFLNPERPSMPDVDMDICQRRRGEVIQYLRDKYGHENVAQIMTYGTIQAKRAVNDMLVSIRPLEWRGPNQFYTSGEAWIKKQTSVIPDGSGADQVHLETFFQEDGDGKALHDRIAALGVPGRTKDSPRRIRYKTRYGRFVDQEGHFLEVPEHLRKGGPEIRRLREKWWADNVEILDQSQKIDLIDTMCRVEGINKYESLHAAGVVVTDRPVQDYVPLMASRDKSGETTGVRTAFDYRQVEELGLLKLDVLGLRNITMLGDMEAMIQEQEPGFKFQDIPLDDSMTYAHMRMGNTAGVFQLEGRGITAALRSIHPTEFQDIVNLLALYRPGPMAQIGEYGRRKKGKTPVKSYHEDVDEILEDTYGLMVFQEQVMELVMKIGDYTLLEADMFRKAIGKKLPKLIRAEIKQFQKRARKRGYKKKLVKEIGDDIFTFGRYGFNRGHSTGYGLITYWTMYIKVNHPDIFFCSLLNNPKGANKKEDRLAQLALIMNDVRANGIDILPPDVNESDENFKIVGPSRIRYGLLQIDGVGESQSRILLTERDKEYRLKTRFRSAGEQWDEKKERMVQKKEMYLDKEPSPSGPYVDFFAFLKRNPSLPTNAKRCLVQAGALDDIIAPDEPPATVLSARRLYSLMINDMNKESKKKNPDFPTHEEWFQESEYTQADLDPKIAMEEERERLGSYVLMSPFEFYGLALELYGALTSGEISPGPVSVGGTISRVKKVVTKKGDNMAHIFIDNEITNQPKITIFPSLWSKVAHFCKAGNAIAVSGKAVESVKYGFAINADMVHDCSVKEFKAEKVTLVPPVDGDALHVLQIKKATAEANGKKKQKRMSKVYVLIHTEDGRLALLITERLLKCTQINIRNLRDLKIKTYVGLADGLVVGNKKIVRCDTDSDSPLWKHPEVKSAIRRLGGRAIAELEYA